MTLMSMTVTVTASNTWIQQHQNVIDVIQSCLYTQPTSQRPNHPGPSVPPPPSAISLQWLFVSLKGLQKPTRTLLASSPHPIHFSANDGYYNDNEETRQLKNFKLLTKTATTTINTQDCKWSLKDLWKIVLRFIGNHKRNI